jgi:hypothetical protein
LLRFLDDGVHAREAGQALARDGKPSGFPQSVLKSDLGVEQPPKIQNAEQ